MKIAVLLNAVSAGKNFYYTRLLPALQKHGDVRTLETKFSGDAEFLAAQALADGFDTILAAGGDGTVYQMVNGIMSTPDAAQPLLGVIPIGGGNDFARSLAIDARPVTIGRMLENKKLQPVDVGLVRYEGKGGTQQRYFINVVDLGMGPHVVRNVTNSRRTFGPGVAYYAAIIKTFYQYRMMNVTAQSTGWQWQGKLRSMALAIGKYYGHGLCVAPDAILDDGIMTAFVCGEVSVFDFIRYSVPLKAGKFVKHPHVHYKQTTHIRLEADQPCLIEADGEYLGTLPATVSMAGRQLNFLSGR